MEAALHQIAISQDVARPRRVRAFSKDDLYEIVAISVLAPASWLVPHRFWDFVSVALSFGIAALRPDITQRRIQRLRQGLGGRSIKGSLLALRVRIMAGYMEERLQILREYRPGGWRGRIDLTGREHLDQALARKHGVVLWVCPFTYSDLITKTVLSREALPVSHLSASSRGFSPNACHPWVPTRFGMRYLSRLRTAVEDRYLNERVVMPSDGSLGYVRRIERLLRGNGILSIRAGKVGFRTMQLPFLGGLVTLATGPPSLSIATGAALVPVFVIRKGPGRFEVVFEPALEPTEGAHPHAATEELMRRYTSLLESYVLRDPYMWSGWYSMRFADAET